MRLRLPITQLTERGDTLVEVLISIAVVSLILGGAYVTTNRSLQATRDAQEHSDALKLVESQVEQLKAIDPAILFAGSTPPSFCVSGNTTFSSTNAACLLNASGSPTTAEPAYRIAITRASNTFTVRNTWTTVKGTRGSVELKYRVYQ